MGLQVGRLEVGVKADRLTTARRRAGARSMGDFARPGVLCIVSPSPHKGGRRKVAMTITTRWARSPVTLRAIVAGLSVGLIAANVWPVLLLTVGAAGAAGAELVFLALYVRWASGSGWPAGTAIARRRAFRGTRLSARQWAWTMVAAVFFAITIHAAIVVLFRLTLFPAADFRRGYDFTFLPPGALRWVAVAISALSAGVCEEVGFRGYMQAPIEERHGPAAAIAVSAFLFMLLHLNQGWASAGMTPIVLGAGVLLGAMAWASGSLIPCMIGHTVMDIGLFAYWWTGLAGTFTAHPISETGLDSGFGAAVVVFAVALAVTVQAILRLRRSRPATV
jgi:membrane protease YdiL (CAAX protease family)